jgi:hypothetical protein
MLSHKEFGRHVDYTIGHEVQRIFSEVPFATHLTGDGQELNTEYYLRHRIETVKRIQLTAATDALALLQMIDIDYDAARPWSKYVAEELDHDRLYLRDLSRHGLSRKHVASVPPFAATVRLISFINQELVIGGPIAAVAYSLFTEWNSARGSLAVVKKAEKQYSAAHVAGSKAHIGIDDDDHHYVMILGIAHKLMSGRNTLDNIDRLLRGFGTLFGAYFEELYHATVAREKRLASA